MKKILLSIFFLLICQNAQATTWYACSGGGNWSANVWTSIIGDIVGCIGATGTPVAGDTAVLNSSSGNITITSAAAAATIDETGYTATLAFGTQTLTLTAASNIGGAMTSTSGFITTTGNITLLSTATGSFPTLNLTGSLTFTSGGFTWPGSIRLNVFTYTLADDMNVTTMIVNSQAGQSTFSGPHNIVVSNLRVVNGNNGTSLALVAGQTLTINTSFISVPNNSVSGTFVTSSVRSVTASSSTFINYKGTPANSDVVGTVFTDVDASGSNQAIYNYNGSTLTRTKNIYNVTAANIGGGAIL